MQHIVKVGQYFYDVSYSQNENGSLIPEKIHAVTDLILFDGAMPILFESCDSIKVADAHNLTVEMHGKVPLVNILVNELEKIPKSAPALQTIAYRSYVAMK